MLSSHLPVSIANCTSLQQLVPVAAEEDEVVLHEVHEHLSDELAHVHTADHLLKDLKSFRISVSI